MSDVPIPRLLAHPAIHSPEELSAQRSNTARLLELAIGYALINVTIWTGGETQRILFWISAAWFFYSFVASAVRREPLGLKAPPWRLAAVVLGLTLCLVAMVLLAAEALGTLHGLFGSRAPLLHGSTYMVWALIQQYIQQVFFFNRIEHFTSTGVRASFVTALLFAVVHLPNPVLIAVTFFGGWVLSELFRRYRTLLPLAIAHGLVGLAIAVCVPDQIHHHMRVGLGYLHYPH